MQVSIVVSSFLSESKIGFLESTNLTRSHRC